MNRMLPEAPFIPAARRGTLPDCEWVVPAAVARHGSYARRYMMLPAGMPDCLEVSIIHSASGTERCTAVLYGKHAYLIHYAFTPHSQVAGHPR